MKPPKGLLKLLEYPEFITGKVSMRLFALHPEDLAWYNGMGLLAAEDPQLARAHGLGTQRAKAPGSSNGEGASRYSEPARPIWVSVGDFVCDVTCEYETPPFSCYFFLCFIFCVIILTPFI